MGENYVLQLKNIRKEYPGVTALKDVSLGVKPGEILALIGENGAGKSTLIKTCSGAVVPTSGKIVINGKEFSSMTPQLAAENGIAIIYQEFSSVRELSAAENLFLGNPIRRGILVDKKAMEREAEKAFAQLHYFAINAVDAENVLNALERLLSYNETLEEKDKIRFVNISTGFGQREEDFRELIYEARDKGILVFTSTMPTVTDPPFALREAAYDDRTDLNNLNNIVIGDWMDPFLRENNMSREELVNIRKEADAQNGYVNVYLPCARRYVASPQAKDLYVYELDGGLSWATPMLTGLTAMASQVNPDLMNSELLPLLVTSIVTNEHGLNIIDPHLLVSLAETAKE
jgi:energy-coupling factor transporter ATP-binding protein EcfA2